jgi:hypothetical protein
MFTTEKSAARTHLQGYVRATLEQLTERFGHPEHYRFEKQSTNWTLEDAQGRVVTVYDWKEEQIPTGTHWWHIGGHTSEVVKSVAEATGLPTQTRDEYYAELDRQVEEQEQLLN